MEAGAGSKHLVNQVLRDAMPANIIETNLLQGMPQVGTERLQGARDILEKGGQIQHGNGTVSDSRPRRRPCHGRCPSTHRKATSWVRGYRIASLAPSTIARASTKRNGEVTIADASLYAGAAPDAISPTLSKGSARHARQYAGALAVKS